MKKWNKALVVGGLIAVGVLAFSTFKKGVPQDAIDAANVLVNKFGGAIWGGTITDSRALDTTSAIKAIKPNKTVSTAPDVIGSQMYVFKVLNPAGVTNYVITDTSVQGYIVVYQGWGPEWLVEVGITPF